MSKLYINPNVNGMRIDVVEALKRLKIPVLRWSGECFADEYHWKDGIGLQKNHKKMIHTHLRGITDKNTFEVPGTVSIRPVEQVKKRTDKGTAFTIPACSVRHISVQ